MKHFVLVLLRVSTKQNDTNGLYRALANTMAITAILLDARYRAVLSSDFLKIREFIWI